MPTANVLLREGKSYSYTHGGTTYKFTSSPTPVSGEDLISKLEAITQLAVERHRDAPPKKVLPKAVRRAEPEPEPEEQEELAADEGDGEAPVDDGSEWSEAASEEPIEELVEEEPVRPVKQAKPAKPAKKGK
jgi:hypothetical protein